MKFWQFVLVHCKLNTSDKTESFGGRKMNDTANDAVEICSSSESTSFVIQRFPSRKFVVIQVFVCAANCALLLPIIVLNGISALTIAKSSQLRRKVCYFLILIQAVVDLTVGTVSHPLETYIRAKEILGELNCVTNFVLSTIALLPHGLTLSTTCALTFERYMGILHPIIHRVHLTKNRFLMYISFTALLLLILAPLGVASRKAYNVCGVALITIALVFNAFAYTKIYITGTRALKMHQNFNDLTKGQIASELATKKKLLKNLKLAKSCGLVVLTFYICYLPAPILNVIFINAHPAEFRAAQSCAAVLCTLNSINNSLIFFWQKPLLRTEALKICRGLCCC